MNKDLHTRIVFTDLVALVVEPESWTSGPRGPQTGLWKVKDGVLGRLIGYPEAAVDL